MARPSPLVILCLAAGCALPDPAPEDLDALVRFAFTHYPEDDEDLNERSLADASRNLLAWVEAEVEDPAEGYSATVTDLTDEELADLDPPPRVIDGAAAVGVIAGRTTRCTLDEIDRLYLDNDQGALHPETYITYERVETSDFDRFRDGTEDEATWLAEVFQEQSLGLASIEYTFSIRSGLRRVDARPASEPGADPVQARLSRTWMTGPATLSNEDLGQFRQNYQLEMMVPLDGGVFHLYGLWTDLDSDTLDTDSALFVNSYIDGLWDSLDSLEVHCP